MKEAEHNDPPKPLTILDTKKRGQKIVLRVKMSDEFHTEFYQFLREKGFLCYGHEKPGIALVLEYGLSDRDRALLERGAAEMETHMSGYAATTFKLHECFEQNSAMASGLRLNLARNRSLKQKLNEVGLGSVVKHDEWDDWDEDRVSLFYQKYVFCR